MPLISTFLLISKSYKLKPHTFQLVAHQAARKQEIPKVPSPETEYEKAEKEAAELKKKTEEEI